MIIAKSFKLIIIQKLIMFGLILITKFYYCKIKLKDYSFAPEKKKKKKKKKRKGSV